MLELLKRNFEVLVLLAVLFGSIYFIGHLVESSAGFKRGVVSHVLR